MTGELVLTRTHLKRAGVALLAAALLAVTAVAGEAVTPTPQPLYQLPSNAQCTKAVTNCVLYPKSAVLPSGRQVAAFEKSTVTSAGSAYGQTIPVYKSDDNGASWQPLAEVQAPAFMSSDPANAKYVSNWTNPYLYVMPQTVGSLTAGTLLLSTVVSGDDYYFLEQKQADPGWVPTHDGARKDTAIALYKSTDGGQTWSFVNIVTTGGWSAARSNANTYAQNDPVWEPYLMVHNGQLVAYYSDERDYTGYNSRTGVPTLAADDATAPDSNGQILAHRTWNGAVTSGWSTAVVDVAGLTQNVNGRNQIGGGRPGMTNVVQTSDNKWLLTYEYFGGGANVKHKVSTNPLDFHSVGGAAGSDITTLPASAGSPALATGGSPVVLRMPDGRLVYNSYGSGDVWVNPSGSSTGAWTRQLTTMAGQYSRNLTYVPATGRVQLMGGFTTIQYADIDLGRSTGPYYKLVNRQSGKALGVLGGNLLDGTNAVQWTDNGSFDQQWHVTTVNGYSTLLNRNSGRALGIWQGQAVDGAAAVQWVENTQNDQQWQLVPVGSHFKLVNRNSGKVLGVEGGSGADGASVVQWSDNGSLDQQWSLVQTTG
jgi:hypothetical protein